MFDHIKPTIVVGISSTGFFCLFLFFLRGGGAVLCCDFYLLVSPWINFDFGVIYLGNIAPEPKYNRSIRPFPSTYTQQWDKPRHVWEQEHVWYLKRKLFNSLQQSTTLCKICSKTAPAKRWRQRTCSHTQKHTVENNQAYKMRNRSCLRANQM